jgi:adenosylcobinamide-phosphate synthase
VTRSSRRAAGARGPGSRGAAVAVAIVADRLYGEPPLHPHPVSAFGALMRAAERRDYADHRAAGGVHAVAGVGVGAAAGAALGSTGLAAYLAIAGRALGEAGNAVGTALDAGDLAAARALLPALVGRDPDGLDAKEIARAAVESIAENTVDAVVAPALWAWAAGAPAALGYRALNTLDAMVGHHSARYESFGWASARADDVANWIPARVAAGLVMLVRPQRAGAVLRTVRRDAAAHPSPNAGVVETAFAAALDLRLGGLSRYGGRTELRPYLGDGRPPEPADIARAAVLSRDVSVALAALMVGGSAAAARRRGRW